MPEKKTLTRARRDLRQGKSPSTAAGEFVREEIEHVREGKHGARSAKQAIAIGLSKARRAGVPLPAPAKGQSSERTRRSAKRELATAQGRRKPRSSSPRRSRATREALEQEPRSSVSSSALSQQARSAAARRKATSTSSSRKGASAGKRSDASKRAGAGKRSDASKRSR